MRILGLCGSLRRNSYNRRLLLTAATELPPDAAFQLFDDIGTIPPYDEDTDTHEVPASVQALRDAITAARGIVIATPEYNASVPGWLKNAIDWASRPYPDTALRGKPVLVVGSSVTEFGASLAQAELRRVLNAIGARVLDAGLSVPKVHEAFAGTGQLANLQLRSQLASLVDSLVDIARVHDVQPCA
jgi:chromate reductase